MLVFSVMAVPGVLLHLLCKCPLVAEEFEVAAISWWSWTEIELPSGTENHWSTLGLTHVFPSFFLGSPPSIRASRGWCTPAPCFHSTFRNPPSWICPRGAAATTASIPPARLQPAAFTSRFVGCACPGPAGPRAARGVVPRGHSGLCCAFCRIPSSRATTSHNSSGLCPAHSSSEHPKL